MPTLKEVLEYLDPKFAQAPEEEKQKILDDLKGNPEKIDRVLSYLDPKYAKAPKEMKIKVLKDISDVSLPEKLWRAFGSGAGELLEDVGTLLKKGAQLLGAKEGETPLSDKLIQIGKEAKEYWMPKKYEEVYKIPVVSDIVEETPSLIAFNPLLKAGAFAGRLATAKKLGELGKTIAENVGAGLAYSAKEYAAGDYTAEDILKQAGFDFVLGGLFHFAGKALSKLPKEKANAVLEKAKSKIKKKDTLTLEDIENFRKELEAGLDDVKKEAEQKGDTEIVKAVEEAKKEISPEEWQKFVKDITQKVREKQPPKQSVEGVVDDISDIRPEPTPTQKVKEQVRDALFKQGVIRRVREKEPPKQVIENVIDDISDIRPEPTPPEKIREQLEEGQKPTKESELQFKIENIKKAFNDIRDEFVFQEKFRKRTYYQAPKIWEKGEKFRIYVPRNAYEQAGYITLDPKDLGVKRVGKGNTGEYKGFYFRATRPGNVKALKKFIDAIVDKLSPELETPKDYPDLVEKYGKQIERVVEEIDPKKEIELYNRLTASDYDYKPVTDEQGNIITYRKVSTVDPLVREYAKKKKIDIRTARDELLDALEKKEGKVYEEWIKPLITREKVEGGDYPDLVELGLFSGIDPFKALESLHKIIRKLDDLLAPIKTETGRKIYDALRRFGGDIWGLGYFPKEVTDQVVYALKKARADFAKSHIKARWYADKVKDWIKQGKVEHGIVIEYLESPRFRETFAKFVEKNPQFREIKDTLDALIRDIEALSEELYKRGYLEKGQFEKWRGRYLSRIYQIEDTLNIDYLSGLRQPEIKKGRKIESIMELSPEERKKLGYVEDAPLAILNTITRAKQILAFDDMYRDLIRHPEIVLREFVVRLPEEVLQKFPELPKEASPYFVAKLLKRIKGNVSKEVYTELQNEVRAKIKTLNALYKNPKGLPKGYALLGDKEKLRFGVLSGLPVNDKFVTFIKGYTRIIDDPDGIASAIDKAVSTFIAAFKMAKVPLNIFTYAWNFLGNIVNWYASGANRPFTWVARAIKEAYDAVIKKKGGYYFKLAQENGLFHTNFTDEEVIKVIRELHAKSKNKIVRNVLRLMNNPITEKAGELYSAMDDIWKLARFMYAIEKEGIKDPIKAIIKADEAHFDYSITGNLIRAMRDPNITKYPGLKLVAPLFPTFMQKSYALMLETLFRRPASFFAVLLPTLLVKYLFIEKLKEKYGEKKINEILKNTPDYLDSPFVIPLFDGKTVYYTKITRLLPHGWMLEFAEDLLKKNLGDAIKDIGGFSLPIYSLVNVLHNRDSLGRPIYKDYEAKLAETGDWKATAKVTGDILWYLLNQTIMPGTITNIVEWRKSRHPILPRLLGTPTYSYTPEELKKWKLYELKQKLYDIRKDIAKLKSLYRRGQISKEEYQKLRQEKIEEMRKLIKAYREGR